MLDAAGEQEQREWLRVTLASIGDGVIATDTEARVTFLNPVAESLTAWTQEEACGQPLNAVFTIVNEETRNLAENPVSRVMKEGVVSGLANHTLLIARDGTERPIDDTAAPIRNARGQVAGAVLVFRDITERRRAERLAQDALTYADNTLATVREPLIVLDKELRVCSANRSFYRVFHVPMEETEGHRIYDLGNGQWNIRRLRELLEDVLPQNHSFEDFEVEHEFPQIGLKTMLLNARRLPPWGGHESLILLAIEEVTERKRAEVRLEESELRYRRLFETARDSILIIDGETGRIMDANPFMAELLGYSRHEFLGKELWEIGLLREKRRTNGLSRSCNSGVHALRTPTARNPRGRAGGGRVRQQCLPGGWEAHNPVQHPGHYRAQAYPARAATGGRACGRRTAQGRVPGDAIPRAAQSSCYHR